MRIFLCAVTILSVAASASPTFAAYDFRDFRAVAKLPDTPVSSKRDDRAVPELAARVHPSKARRGPNGRTRELGGPV